jgi:hypothetical protein
MTTQERCDEIIHKAFKRYVKDTPDGFCFDMDMLEQEIKYHLDQAYLDGTKGTVKRDE